MPTAPPSAIQVRGGGGWVWLGVTPGSTPVPPGPATPGKLDLPSKGGPEGGHLDEAGPLTPAYLPGGLPFPSV